MITGDNPLTAAAIAAEAGVDDFLAEATTEGKLSMIRAVSYTHLDVYKRQVRYSADNVFDYIELTEEYSIYEIPPLPEWTGKTLSLIHIWEQQ